MPYRSLLLIGPTGSGKTPLGNLLESKAFGRGRFCHFDFGQELRDIGCLESPPDGFSREDHLFIRKVLEEGVLLEKRHFHIAKKTIRRFIRCKDIGIDDAVVLNGLPRHREQAEDMDDLVDVRTVVVLECSPEDVYGRISTNAGSDRSGRSDDGLAMVRKKLGIFERRTLPLVEYYAGKGVEIFTEKVCASSSAEEVLSALLHRGFCFQSQKIGKGP